MSLLNQKFWVFFSAAVISVVFLCLAGPVVAATPFQDSFEAYLPGSIKGQGSWNSEYSGCTIQTSYKKTGAQALSCIGNTAYRIGPVPLSTGTAWEFWVYNPSSGDHPDGRFKLIDGNGTTIGTISYISSLGNIYATNNVNQLMGSAPHQSWVQVGFRWDRTAQTVGYGYNGVWTDYPAPAGFDEDVAEIYFLEQNNKNIIVDDITGASITVAGYDPIIAPTDPLDGQTTIQDLTEFNITGKVEIPTANPWIWHDLNVFFDKLNTTETYHEIIPLPDLVAGQDYTYSATSTLDNDYAYSVRYQLAGETTYYTTAIYNHAVANTYITYTAPITPSWTIAGPWPIPELEDCSALTGLDKLVCDIKNFLLGMVIPTQAKFDELNNTFKAFLNVFPLPYLRSMQTFITTTNAGINESSGINFSLFGQAGTVDFSALSFSVAVGGLTVDFNDLLKYFLSGACFAAFVFWALNFLNRIF